MAGAFSAFLLAVASYGIAWAASVLLLSLALTLRKPGGGLQYHSNSKDNNHFKKGNDQIIADPLELSHSDGPANGACKEISIGLVIAHPDDESMFFAPTMTKLQQHPEYRLHVLCLSTGNADGLGQRRTEELKKACAFFGVPHSRVIVIDHPEIQDGFHSGGWQFNAISPILSDFVLHNSISALITFDSYGVSGHPNHKSVCQAARRFVEEQRQKDSRSCDLWELRSVHLAVKFLGPLYALCQLARVIVVGGPMAQSQWNGTSHRPDRHFFLPTYLTCFNAMRLHASQWVWFRWLFVLFSTYPYHNCLVLWSARQVDHKDVASRRKQE